MIHIYSEDTLFLINYDNVLKKFRSDYFLNLRFDKASWFVRKMQLSKGQLIISEISVDQEVRNIHEITEYKQDTAETYNFTLTKKQFKEFVKNNGFRKSETFIKLKNN